MQSNTYDHTSEITAEKTAHWKIFPTSELKFQISEAFMK